MKTQRATVIAVALCGTLAVALPSYGAMGAQLSIATQQFGSGEYGAAPSTTSLAFGAQGVSDIYFTVTNTGTLPLTGATYTVSASNLKAGMSFSLVACVGGTWVVLAGVCTGGVTQTIVTSTGAASSAAVSAIGFPAATGSTVTLQAHLNKNPARTTVGTVTVTVNRSQVRAATVTNS